MSKDDLLKLGVGALIALVVLNITQTLLAGIAGLFFSYRETPSLWDLGDEAVRQCISALLALGTFGISLVQRVYQWWRTRYQYGVKYAVVMLLRKVFAQFGPLKYLPNWIWPESANWADVAALVPLSPPPPLPVPPAPPAPQVTEPSPIPRRQSGAVTII